MEEINKELVPANAITELNSVDKIAAYIQTIPNLLSNSNNSISGEATARQNADNALSQSISNETSARQNADEALSNRIKTIEDTEYVLKSTYDAKILELEQRITDLEAAINNTT